MTSYFKDIENQYNIEGLKSSIKFYSHFVESIDEKLLKEEAEELSKYDSPNLTDPIVSMAVDGAINYLTEVKKSPSKEEAKSLLSKLYDKAKEYNIEPKI